MMATKKKVPAKAAARKRRRAGAPADPPFGISAMVRTRGELTALLVEAAVAAERLGMTDHEDALRALVFNGGARAIGDAARRHLAGLDHPAYAVQRVKGGRKVFAEELAALIDAVDERRAREARASCDADDLRLMVTVLWPLWERLDCTEKRAAKNPARTLEEFAKSLAKKHRERTASGKELARQVATALCGDAKLGGNLAQHAHRPS